MPTTLWSVLIRFCGPSSTPGCCLCTTAHTPPTFCGWCLHACRPQARTFPSRLISCTPTPTTVASRGATAYFFYCRGRSNRYSTVTTCFGPTVGYLAPGSHPVWLHRWYLKLISVVGAADAFTVVCTCRGIHAHGHSGTVLHVMISRLVSSELSFDSWLCCCCG